MRRAKLGLLAVLVVTAACGSDDDAARSTAPPPTTSGADMAFTTVPGSITPLTPAGTAPPSPSVPSGGSDEQQAIADLAARQGVDPSMITTVSVEEVTWRSGAIGCPEPGVGYTQALVPGVRVILELDGRRYEYHAGGGRSAFLCLKPEPPASG